MGFLTAACSDIGIRKKINQDSYCIKSAKTCIGTVLMAAICDGMGGLARGEVASASVITAFSKWFDVELPKLIRNFSVEEVKQQWRQIIKQQNKKISLYGESLGISLGTTLTVMLILDDDYVIIGHVGDSRAYQINTSVHILTEDQTVVAREVRQNKITKEQAVQDSRKNILLQCIGASKNVLPDFIVEKVDVSSTYMLCTDGFRNRITESEILEHFSPNVLVNESAMKLMAEELVEINKMRLEKDNITVLLMKLI